MHICLKRWVTRTAQTALSQDPRRGPLCLPSDEIKHGYRIHIFCKRHTAACPQMVVRKVRSGLLLQGPARPEQQYQGCVCGHDSHYLSDGNDTGPVGRGGWGLLVCTPLTAPSPAGSRLRLVLACNDGAVGGAGFPPRVRTWVIAPTLVLSGTNPAPPPPALLA